MADVYAATRVAVIGTVGTQQVVNVFNVAGDANVLDATTAVAEAFGTHFGPWLSSDYVHDSAHGIDMRSAEGGTATVSMTGWETGGGGDALEIGLSGIVRWADTVSGRAFRPGRSYLGPIPRVYCEDVGLRINSGGSTALQTAATGFATALVPDHPLVIVHGLGRPTQQVAPVVSASVAPGLGHLDSRRR